MRVVRDFPEDTSPLTRPHRSKPGVTEKWDLYVRGMELGTAYSELADPVIQRERLVAQSLEAANGDPEAMQLDEDFLRALEFGAPPMGGMGLGIDRTIMLFTGAGIRETILFPLLKPAGPLEILAHRIIWSMVASSAPRLDWVMAPLMVSSVGPPLPRNKSG